VKVGANLGNGNGPKNSTKDGTMTDERRKIYADLCDQGYAITSGKGTIMSLSCHFLIDESMLTDASARASSSLMSSIQTGKLFLTNFEIYLVDLGR